MKSSVIVFPGSNCDRDIAVALTKFNIKNEMVWHNDTNLPKSDLVVLPGGFSYGDYLRTGCIASKARIIKEVISHANKGGLVLICVIYLIFKNFPFDDGGGYFRIIFSKNLFKSEVLIVLCLS